MPDVVQETKSFGEEAVATSIAKQKVLEDGIATLPSSDQAFAYSLLSQWKKNHTLSTKQMAYVNQFVEEIQSPALPGLGKTEAPVTLVGDFSGVIAFFKAAKVQFPKLRLNLMDGSPVALSMAGTKSKYPGTVNVTDGKPFGQNVWYGRVTKDGKWEQSHSARDRQVSLSILLMELSKDPIATAAAYGHATGNCCFCMSGLTDERSIERGYGPVCAKHWGLPWGNGK